MEFFSTIISEKSIELAMDVLRSTHVSAGKVAVKFEQALIDKLGLVNPVSVNSCTSALHLGLKVSGVRIGDEVILPAQTFVASGMAPSATRLLSYIGACRQNLSYQRKPGMVQRKRHSSQRT
jgi:dTDP-4-amino-4,6-dideoxygalactose transaminase